MREKIAEIEFTNGDFIHQKVVSGKDTWYFTDLGVEKIIAFFRSEISKLKPLSDEEMAKTTGHTLRYLTFDKILLGKFRIIAQAQLDSIKEQLKEVMK